MRDVLPERGEYHDSAAVISLVAEIDVLPLLHRLFDIYEVDLEPSWTVNESITVTLLGINGLLVRNQTRSYV